jgi:hypothetical protein
MRFELAFFGEMTQLHFRERTGNLKTHLYPVLLEFDLTNRAASWQRLPLRDGDAAGGCRRGRRRRLEKAVDRLRADPCTGCPLANDVIAIQTAPMCDCNQLLSRHWPKHLAHDLAEPLGSHSLVLPTVANQQAGIETWQSACQ